jgi:hypothetical protein
VQQVNDLSILLRWSIADGTVVEERTVGPGLGQIPSMQASCGLRRRNMIVLTY